MNITIFGAGSFGTAAAVHLALLGHNILIWTRRRAQAEQINTAHTNDFCFTDTRLADTITATNDMAVALAYSDRYILAIPTQSLRDVCGKLASYSPKGGHMLNLAKGMEISTGKLPHSICSELCPQFTYSVLSGPSHAEEVILNLPTTVALASRVDTEAKSWQDIMNGGNFRVYTATDVMGVETGGALKNIYAIAAGISRALKLGDNALAALASRGLAEIMRFGVKIGASPLTLSGLAGAGDLMVTCYSMHSRNFRLGLAIGHGKSLKDAAAELGQVAEGAYTVRAVIENSRRFGVEMPLADAVYRVLYDGAEPHTVLKELFARPPKPEMRL